MTEARLGSKNKELYEESLDLSRQKFIPDPEKIVDYAKNWTRAKIATFKRYLSENLGLKNWYGEHPNRAEATDHGSFKNMVSRALAGDNLDKEIYEVPYRELVAENAYGLWEGRTIKIPRLRDIPEMFGTVYKNLFRKVKESGGAQREQDFNHDLQTYIRLHEEIEADTKSKNHGFNHGRYEATLLNTLKNLACEGSKMAKDVYKAALATYKKRFEVGDGFAKEVQRYYTQLKEEVANIFGKRPVYMLRGELDA